MEYDFSAIQDQTFALRAAARTGDVAGLVKLLASEPKVHPNEIFPWAASAGEVKACEILLEAGVSIHRKLGGHMTVQSPLLFAAEGGPPIVDLLLDRGANACVVDDNDKTAAHELLNGCRAHVQKFGEPALINTLERLLSAGVKPDRCTKYNKSLLQVAIESGAQADTLSALAKAGARLDLRNSEGLEPIHVAAATCNLSAMDLLLARGVHADAEDARGMTALFHCKKAAAVGVLLERGANLEHKDIQGSTALAKLLRDKPEVPLDAIKGLLEAGAQPDNADLSGTTPKDIITSRRLKEVKSMLATLKAHRSIQSVLDQASPRPA
jgi:ankyrin repeat protein